MAREAKLKADQIEGLRELVAQIILEERDKLVPVSLLQDVEEIRRSPAGAVIRMEGAIEHLKEGLTNLGSRLARLEERMATKEELGALRGEVKGLAERMATKEGLAGLEKRVDTLRAIFFAFLTLITGLQIAILVKLFL
jgi:hypothetical protein